MIKSIVYEIISDLCGISVECDDKNLIEDLGMDSISMVTMMLNLEERFNILIDESDINPFDLITVKDVVILMYKYVDDDCDLENME